MTIEILFPLIFLNSLWDKLISSLSLKIILPFLKTFFWFSNPKINLVVTDLPEPDSPTKATFSPFSNSKLIFFRTFSVPSYILKDSSKFLIDNNLLDINIKHIFQTVSN